MINCTPRPFLPRERIAVPTEQEAGWGPQPVWTSGVEEKKKSVGRTPGFEPPAVRPVAKGKGRVKSPKLLKVGSYNL